MTNTNEKAPRITKTMRFEDIALMLQGEPSKNGTTIEDALAFIAHEREMLANKNKSSGEKKLTPTQVANIGYKEMVKAFLADNPDVTCSAIAKGVPEFNAQDFTTSKVNGLLRSLLQDGDIERHEVHGKALFRLVQVG